MEKMNPTSYLDSETIIRNLKLTETSDFNFDPILFAYK